MNRRQKVTKALIYIIVLIVVLFFGLYMSGLLKNSNEEVPFDLDKDELLIDYTLEGPLAYVLINRNNTKEYGDTFLVFERSDDSWNRIYENDFKNLMPWKVEVADIDGDNTAEIMIALRKKTPYDKEIKNRMFIFNFQDNILARKWTGSKIAGIWRDFYPMDLLSAPGYELVFIEQTEEDKEKISIYSWFDFGFFMMAESEAYQSIQTMHMLDKNRLEITYIKDEEKKEQVLSVVDGKLIAKDKD